MKLVDTAILLVAVLFAQALPGSSGITDGKNTGSDRDKTDPMDCPAPSGPEIQEGGEYTSIDIPDNISEESGITALVKSEAFKLIFNNGVYPTITSKDAKSSSPYYLAKRAQLLPLPRTTSGVVKKNYIEVDIAPNNSNAGSTTDHIRMWFSPSKVLKLKGSFTQGASLHWNLNEGKYYLETIDNDLWDDIILENPSGDGIKVKRIKIVHNSVVILNWQNANIWLDHSKLESHSHLGLASKILETKLAKVDAQYNWITQIHYALRELGKSDGIKYNAEPGEPWCSEFASWCLRKALWKTPSVWVPNGILDIEEMENYFATLGRLVPKADLVKQNPFILKAGDYLSFQWRDGGTHSALFVAYKNSPPAPGAANDNTEIITVEGNTGGRVNVRKSRTLQWVRNAGNTQ